VGGDLGVHFKPFKQVAHELGLMAGRKLGTSDVIRWAGAPAQCRRAGRPPRVACFLNCPASVP